MKLKIGKMDKDGKSTSLGIFSDITDADKRESEIMEMDTIQIDELRYSRRQGILQIFVLVGGHDSKGAFHPCHRYGQALISIHRDSGDNNLAQIWKDYDLDNVEGFDWKTLKQMLLDIKAVDVLARNQWAAPDCTGTIEQTS
jgi:hypothetical protein